MNNLLSTIIIFTIVLSFAPSVVAQPLIEINETEIFAAALEEEKSSLEYTPPPANAIPSAYEGYKVIIYSSSTPLTKEHDIFRRFGNIQIFKSQGIIYYTIGDFKTQEQATEFSEKIISKKYPNYKLVKCEKGKRSIIY